MNLRPSETEKTGLSTTSAKLDFAVFIDLKLYILHIVSTYFHAII